MMILNKRLLLKAQHSVRIVKSQEISLQQMSTAATQMEVPKYLPSRDLYKAPLLKHYKAIVVGGGHNGLVAAAYLAKSGFETCNVSC